MCNGDVLVLLERCYRTTDRYDKEQTSASDEDSKSDGGMSAAATGHCGLRPLCDCVRCEPGHWTISGKSVKFKQQCMRSFLVDCIKKRHMDTFPTVKVTG